MVASRISSAIWSIRRRLVRMGYLFVIYLRLDSNEKRNVRRILLQSRSQLMQDLFALLFHKFKESGYFVEFGATNGVELSNTYLMERKFGWSGILAEPARIWHNSLIQNRFCEIDFRCVWSKSDEILEFDEAYDANFSRVSSTPPHYIENNGIKSKKRYEVRSVSLTDLLAQKRAPETIDFLSLDTEGGEYEILENFNFGKFRVLFIVCEHNFTNQQTKIARLFRDLGYLQINPKITLWDSWFIHPSIHEVPNRLKLLYRLKVD